MKGNGNLSNILISFSALCRHQAQLEGLDQLNGNLLEYSCRVIPALLGDGQAADAGLLTPGTVASWENNSGQARTRLVQPCPSLSLCPAQSHLFYSTLPHAGLLNPPPPPLPAPRRTTHTLSVLVWVPSRFAARRCRRTGRHSASLRVHCSRSASRFACVSRDEHDRRMTWRRTHVQKYTRAHLVVWERQRESDALCVCGLFWVSVF